MAVNCLEYDKTLTSSQFDFDLSHITKNVVEL